MGSENLSLRVQNAKYSNLSIGLIIVFSFIVINVANIEKYGLGKDAGVHMFRGEVFLHYILTGEKDYSNLPLAERCNFQEIDPEYNYLTPSFFMGGSVKESAIHMKRYGGGVSMGGLASAVTCRIFHKRLGWLDPVDAHNMGSVLFGAFTILIVYLFALEAFGLKVALLSSVFLALYPPFIGYSHISIKDMPVVFFVSSTVWVFWKGVVHKNYKWLWLAVILFGMGMVSKFNAAYAVMIIGAWLLFPIKHIKHKFEMFSIRSIKFWSLITLAPLVYSLTFILFSPPHWPDNVQQIPKKIIAPVASFIGMKKYVITKKTPFTPGHGGIKEKPWRFYRSPAFGLITVPLPILFFAIFGAWSAVRNRRKEPKGGAWLAFLWAVVPVVFCMFPYLNIYDSIREFLVYVPGVCLLAGIGADAFYAPFKNFISRFLAPKNVPVAYKGVVALAIASVALSTVEYHPYEITFLNNLVGGLQGAQNLQIPFSGRKGIPDAEDFRGTSIRNAMEWVDKHGEPGALLEVFNPKSNKFITMKKSMKILPYRWDIYREQREKVKNMEYKTVYIIFNNTYHNRLHPVYGYCYNNLTPRYKTEADGVPINFVYQMSKEEFLKIVF